MEKPNSVTTDLSGDRELPDEEALIKQVMLTENTVWKNNIKKSEIDKWLKNFSGKVEDIDYERRIALWLLSNFVYYNLEEIRHLCVVMYREYIHQRLSEMSPSRAVDDFKKIAKDTRFASLGNFSESSFNLLYYFRQGNILSIDSFDFPDKKKDLFDNLVFIEDVTVTGKQAARYLKNFKEDFIKNKNLYLLTLISTEESIQFLKNKGITVIPSITLDDRSKCFSPNSAVFHNFKKVFPKAKKFAQYYGKICLENQNRTYEIDPLGFEDGQLLCAFPHNTPNNTLPIFWADNEKWSSLFKRYEKDTNEVYTLGNYV